MNTTIILEFELTINIFNDKPSNIIDCATFQIHNNMPTVKYIFKYLSRDMPSTKKATTLPLTINFICTIKSKEKVFFIKYTTDGIVKVRFYLVQVDI